MTAAATLHVTERGRVAEYASWASYRRTRRCGLHASTGVVRGASCGMCGGQGRIYEPTDDACPDLVPVVCETCRGTGRA